MKDGKSKHVPCLIRTEHQIRKYLVSVQIFRTKMTGLTGVARWTKWGIAPNKEPRPVQNTYMWKSETLGLRVLLLQQGKLDSDPR